MKTKSIMTGMLLLVAQMLTAQEFKLNKGGYFNNGGVDVMAFSDFYPEGHQGGVCVIMNGKRVATNGDIRMEATPGQWQPVPKQLGRKVEANSIVTTLAYPDSSRHETGFNPMTYPDYVFNYVVRLEAQGKSLVVTVDIDKPVPDFLLGKVGFNMEFFPGELLISLQEKGSGRTYATSMHRDTARWWPTTSSRLPMRKAGSLSQGPTTPIPN